MPLIREVDRACNAARKEASFQTDYDYCAKHYIGRPSPLYFAERLTAELRKGAGGENGAKIYFKRDELNTPAPTRPITCWGRSCWRGTWARPASSPRPAPVSMASPPPPSARYST